MHRIVSLFCVVLLLALAGAAHAYTLMVTNQTSPEDGVSVRCDFRGDYGLVGAISTVMPGNSSTRNITGREAEDCFREIKITPLQAFPGCPDLFKEVTLSGSWCDHTNVKVKRDGCGLAVEAERLVNE